MGFLLVYKEANETARAKTNDGRNGEGRGRKAQAYSTNEDNGLQAFAKDCDEGKDEHRVLLAPYLEPSPNTPAFLGTVSGLERLCQLDTPLGLKLGHAEQRCTHCGDDESSKETERAFPDGLGPGPSVFANAIECSDYTPASNDTNEKAQAGPPPNLQTMRHCTVLPWPTKNSPVLRAFYISPDLDLDREFALERPVGRRR